MKSTRIMRFTVLLIFLGFSTNVLVQGARRVLKVRKTGEYGRRIAAPALSQLYQPPPRFSGLDPFLAASETQNSVSFGSSGIDIRKPSQKLELPSFGEPDSMSLDSLGAETRESLQGYSYPDPDSEQTDVGFEYNPAKVKHPAAAALAEYPESDPGEEDLQQVEDQPENVVPQVEAEFPSSSSAAKPFGAETEERIDSSLQRPISPPAPKPVANNRPVVELDANKAQSESSRAESSNHGDGTGQTQCNDNDPNCWPHGYEGVIPGEAGKDYPTLREIVDTPFDCDNVQYSGYYADTDPAARCQIFHVCLKGNAHRSTQKWSFLCPNGTSFSQSEFVCVWWYSAPECSSAMVNQLSLRNAELGWDNMTETRSDGGRGGGDNENFDVKSAMNSLRNGNSNLQASGSNFKSNNAFPSSPTTRRAPSPSSRSAIPYRVPVKVNARTQLKEVAGNGLQGESGGSGANGNNEAEYTGEESEAYETSLTSQSESRHRSKSASALSKSESEAYEQKSVPDSVSPFVNRAPEDTTENGQESLQVVMMPTHQRNPDGTEAYAEVPVMGYRYPTPNSVPDLGYLPPRNEFVPQSTTTTDLPNTTTYFPVTEQSIPSGYQEQYTNSETEEPSANLVESTTPGVGYNYPVPTTTLQPGSSGYNYAAPTTTDGPSYREVEEIDNNQVPDIEQGGVAAFEASTFTPDTTTIISPTIPTTVTARATSTQQNAVESTAYLPPLPTQQGYDSPVAVAVQSNAPSVLRLSPAAPTATPGNEALSNKLVAVTSTINPSEGTTGYTNAGDLSTSIPVSGGYNSASESSSNIQLQTDTIGTTTAGGDRSTLAYTVPTPSSSSSLVGGPAVGANLDTTQDERVNKILQEIQNGGAEVRDENGNTLNFEELKKLILSTPNGLLSLQKAETDTTETDSSSSSVTELPGLATTDGTEQEQELEDEEEVVQDNETEPVTVETPTRPVLHEVATIEETPTPRQRYLPQSVQTLESLSQQSYFTNDRLVSIKRPGFEISAPSKEYETHLVQKNTLEQQSLNTNQPSSYSGFTTFQPERQNQIQPLNSAVISNNFQETPNRDQFVVQNYANNQQNTQAPQVYFQRPSQTEQLPQQYHQQEFRVQPVPAPASAPEVNFLRPSVPQPDQYYRTQSQILPTPQQQFNSNPDNSYFPQQTPQVSRPTQSSNFRFPNEGEVTQQNSQYFQQQQQSTTREYLPPPPPPTQSQFQYAAPAPTPYRNGLSTPTRDLTNDIQLQQSYSFPLSQASTTSARNVGNPHDIKVVPALLVNTHTRVELPNGQPQKDGRNFNEFRQSFQQQQQNSLNRNANQYVQYSSPSQSHPVKVRAPRLNRFTLADALPKPQKFTAAESRTIEQVLRYRASAIPTTSTGAVRHFRAGSGSGLGHLALPSEHNSLTNFYPGRDNSLGVKLTYN